MRISIDMPMGVHVVASSDHKGNPVTYLEILGAQVLYARGETPGGLDPSTWEEIFTTRLGYILADLILDNSNGGLKEWSEESPTGREVYRRDSEDYVREV